MMGQTPLTLNHIGLMNFNEADAQNFYGHILGFEEQYRFSLTPEESQSIFSLPQELTVIVFSNGHLKLEIFIPQKAVSFNTGTTHVCLNVQHRQMIVERCREKGLPVLELRRNGKTIVFVKDFAGNIFELKRQ